MQVIGSCYFLLGLLLGLSGSAFAATPGGSSGQTQTALVRNAKLVYAEELIEFMKAPNEQPGPWQRHMPSNIDAFASANKTVLGVFETACVRRVAKGYAPSGCDGQWLMVVELGLLPEVGEMLEFSDERIVAAGLFYGDRHAGARAGCLGYPTHGGLEVIERTNRGTRIRINLVFNLKQHARYPADCGQQKVNGDFFFVETSTDDIPTGGLGRLF